MTVELRDARVADYQSCINLLAELQAATGGQQSKQMRDVFEALVQQQRGRIIIAEEDTAILGLATVSYNLAMRYGGEYCQLEELIVTPAARGKQVGALLMQGIIADARSRGCSEIGLYLLAATEHNQAFYGKYGFAVVGHEMRLRLDSDQSLNQDLVSPAK